MDNITIKKHKSAAAKFNFKSVTPGKLSSAITSAQSGSPAELFGILQFFLQMDDEIPGALGSLSSAIVQEEIDVIQIEESTEAETQATVIREVLQNLDMPGLIQTLAEAHYYGVRAVQPVWNDLDVAGKSYQVPTTYEVIPLEWIHAPKVETVGRRSSNAGAEKKPSILHVGSMPLHEYPSGSILFLSQKKLPSFTDIDFTSFGRGLAASRWGIFAWFGVEDWAAYNEIFALPTIVGTELQGANPTDKKILKDAVTNLGNDSRMIVSEKVKVELLERTGSSTGVFDTFLSACARARARIIKSESLTDNMGKNGSNAAMVTANGVKLDIAKGVAKSIERLLNRRFITPILDLNFGKRLVRIRIPVKQAPNTLHQVAVDRLMIESGVPLSISDLRERYNRPAPIDDDDTLATNTASATPFTPFGP